MTDEEMLNELGSKSRWDRARQVFSSWAAKIEQAGQQRKPLTPMKLRHMEFEAAKAIAEALGTRVDD
jgi:hypothetical protein